MWQEYGFEILVGLTILFILCVAFFRRGKKGTWSEGIRFPETPSYSAPRDKRKPPQESKGELECRRVLETLFKLPFSKARPDFLRNPVTKDYNLELDCFNPELKLAVEYNGTQHYNYIPFFHRTKDAFNNQKYRDHMKREICEKNGVVLIEVPYTVKVEDIEEYLLKELKSLIQ